jgi:hypothetical protein
MTDDEVITLLYKELQAVEQALDIIPGLHNVNDRQRLKQNWQRRVNETLRTVITERGAIL